MAGKRNSGTSLAIGLALGLPIGSGVGMLLFDNLPLGMLFGAAIGLAFGAGMSGWGGDGDEDDAEAEAPDGDTEGPEDDNGSCNRGRAVTPRTFDRSNFPFALVVSGSTVLS